MNWKHLFWIVPVVLAAGLFIGWILGLTAIDTLADMTERIDKCSMQTLQYAMDHNNDCKVLIAGYMTQCTKNLTGAQNE